MVRDTVVVRTVDAAGDTVDNVKSNRLSHITTHNSSIRSDEGLTLEASAFQSLYGGQFTLSTLLINQIFVSHIKTRSLSIKSLLTCGETW